MNSQNLEIASIILGIIAIIVSLVAIYFSGKARSWLLHFRKEEQPENLEDIIEKIAGKLNMLETNQSEMDIKLSDHEKVLATAIQHVGLIRFDSGADDGGNLSFAAAFLDAHQSGVILTSLHGRQHNRIYSKIVKNGASEQTLSEEEKEALIQALTNKANN